MPGNLKIVEALPYRDRAEAGRRLVPLLEALGLERPLVLAVPRGGALIAEPVARGLDGDLDVVVVRKVGAPGNPELGLGAVGADGDAVLDRRLVESLDVSDEFLERQIAAEREEAVRRIEAYRGARALPEVGERDVVVVDDGIATGGTVRAAAGLLRARGPRRLALAVPVAPGDALERLRGLYDDVVCTSTPDPYLAVGQWYEDFHQVTDDEVRAVLAT